MCTWCEDPNAEDWTENLCRTHQAEYGGVSVDWLDRRDAGQYAEYLDTLG